jgi:hypothetical protein
MAREIAKLKALDVSRTSKPGYYGDGGNLYLLVGPTGAKSWVFRYRVPAPTPDKPKHSRLREMGLGPTHALSLAEARERAREWRRERLDGIDPIEPAWGDVRGHSSKRPRR